MQRQCGLERHATVIMLLCIHSEDKYVYDKSSLRKPGISHATHLLLCIPNNFRPRLCLSLVLYPRPHTQHKRKHARRTSYVQTRDIAVASVKALVVARGTSTLYQRQRRVRLRVASRGVCIQVAPKHEREEIPAH